MSITISCPIGPVAQGSQVTATGTIEDCDSLVGVSATCNAQSLAIVWGCVDGSWWATVAAPAFVEGKPNVIQFDAVESGGTTVSCDVAVKSP